MSQLLGSSAIGAAARWYRQAHTAPRLARLAARLVLGGDAAGLMWVAALGASDESPPSSSTSGCGGLGVNGQVGAPKTAIFWWVMLGLAVVLGYALLAYWDQRRISSQGKSRRFKESGAEMSKDRRKALRRLFMRISVSYGALLFGVVLSLAAYPLKATSDARGLDQNCNPLGRAYIGLATAQRAVQSVPRLMLFDSLVAAATSANRGGSVLVGWRAMRAINWFVGRVLCACNYCLSEPWTLKTSHLARLYRAGVFVFGALYTLMLFAWVPVNVIPFGDQEAQGRAQFTLGLVSVVAGLALVLLVLLFVVPSMVYVAWVFSRPTTTYGTPAPVATQPAAQPDLSVEVEMAAACAQQANPSDSPAPFPVPPSDKDTPADEPGPSQDDRGFRARVRRLGARVRRLFSSQNRRTLAKYKWHSGVILSFTVHVVSSALQRDSFLFRIIRELTGWTGDGSVMRAFGEPLEDTLLAAPLRGLSACVGSVSCRRPKEQAPSASAGTETELRV